MRRIFFASCFFLAMGCNKPAFNEPVCFDPVYSWPWLTDYRSVCEQKHLGQKSECWWVTKDGSRVTMDCDRVQHMKSIAGQ